MPLPRAELKLAGSYSLIEDNIREYQECLTKALALESVNVEWKEQEVWKFSINIRHQATKFPFQELHLKSMTVMVTEILDKVHKSISAQLCVGQKGVWGSCFLQFGAN